VDSAQREARPDGHEGDEEKGDGVPRGGGDPEPVQSLLEPDAPGRPFEIEPLRLLLDRLRELEKIFAAPAESEVGGDVQVFGPDRLEALRTTDVHADIVARAAGAQRE